MKTKINKQIQVLTEDQHSELSEIHYGYEQAMLLSQQINKLAVTFYGGARLDTNTHTYKEIYELAENFSQRGWAVITGGGPGVMEAGLLGAKKSKISQAVGFRLRLKHEEPKIYGDIDFQFEHFPPRKYALRQSTIYIYCPGSVGTLDELMENLDLMKTNKMPKKKIYLFNSNYWSGLTDWMEKTIIDEWKLGDNSLKDLYKIVDTKEEILKDIFG
jgi:uncharacterized protein (TIGR00730 family)